MYSGIAVITMNEDDLSFAELLQQFFYPSFNDFCFFCLFVVFVDLTIARKDLIGVRDRPQ